MKKMPKTEAKTWSIVVIRTETTLQVTAARDPAAIPELQPGKFQSATVVQSGLSEADVRRLIQKTQLAAQDGSRKRRDVVHSN